MIRVVIATAFWFGLWVLVAATVMALALQRLGMVPAIVLWFTLLGALLLASVPLARVYRQVGGDAD